MKKKLKILFCIITAFFVGILNTACSSQKKLFEQRNIVSVNVSYLDEQKIKDYELESGEKYPYSHLLEITNNSNEVIQEGNIFFDFINDMGIKEQIYTNFYTLSPGESFFTYIKGTKKDISPSRIIYKLMDSQKRYELSLEDEKVNELSVVLNEFIDFNEHNIISFENRGVTLEDKGYMTNIFVNTHYFDVVNNSDLDIEDVSGYLYFYDDDNNIIDIKHPFCSLEPNETKSTYVKEDDLPRFTKEIANTNLVGYEYRIYDSEENCTWEYYIDLTNKVAFRSKFKIS